MASGWKDSTFRPEVKCKAKDGLCVSVAIGHLGFDAWTVDHITSGKRIGVFKVEASAYEFAEAILPLADWKAIRDENGLTDELVATVRAIGAEFADGHV